MFIDGRSLPDGETLSTDICIIGGGPAGILLALELAGSGRDVTLLEAGDIYYEDATQDLMTGPVLGHPYTPLDEARLRFLGGSSNHWSGNCLLYTEVDFEKRDWMPYSGWPITLSDLMPYYDRALPYYELPVERSFDFDHWATTLGGRVLDVDTRYLKNTAMMTSPPTIFGYTYEDRLAAAPGVSVYLNCNVTELDTTDDGNTVTTAKVTVLDGPKLTVRARTFVVSAGGIETPRLLLNSTRVKPAGIGNDNDLVGRFFNEHPSIRPVIRTLVPRGAEPLTLYHDFTPLDTGGFWACLTSSEEMLRREEVGGFVFNLFQDDRSPGDLAIRRLTGALRTGEAPPYLSTEIGNLLSDLDGATNAIAGDVFGRDDRLIGHEWLGPWISWECVPNPDSRVVLLDEVDRIGMRKIGLDWRFHELDMRTLKRSVEVLISELSRLGVGRSWTEVLRDDYEIPMTVGQGKHHACTTRMSDDPATGVVDADCRVHGMSNLYINGCATFATGGYTFPTFTIGAMAIRLADHLKATAPDTAN